jgi:putative SOS response-associated peptidase YedK
LCGRYVSTSSLTDLADLYGIDEIMTESLGPRYNVAPGQPVYAVVARRSPPARPDLAGKLPTLRLGTLHWGLVPSWAADRSVAGKLINARSEGIATRPSFRQALSRRRCVLPADAFYEWRIRPEAPRGPRQPHLIRRRDGGVLSFAGLWETWRDPAAPGDPPWRTATIVTTAANDALAPIHARMPVVLSDDALRTWLDPTVVDPAVLTAALVPAPSAGWVTWPVSTQVNAVANDGPELVDPVEAPPAGVAGDGATPELFPLLPS